MGLQIRGDQDVMHCGGRQFEIAREGPDRPSTVGLYLTEPSSTRNDDGGQVPTGLSLSWLVHDFVK